MTRQEEIRNAIDAIIPIPPSENGRKYEQALMATGFEAGVKWADEHPKSPWISVKDDLPCNHKDLMKNENYTKRVLVVLSWNEDPTHIHIDISDMSNVFGSYNVGFYWRCNGYYTVTHWREMPGLPI